MSTGLGIEKSLQDNSNEALSPSLSSFLPEYNCENNADTTILAGYHFEEEDHILGNESIVCSGEWALNRWNFNQGASLRDQFHYAVTRLPDETLFYNGHHIASGFQVEDSFTLTLTPDGENDGASYLHGCGEYGKNTYGFKYFRVTGYLKVSGEIVMYRYKTDSCMTTNDDYQGETLDHYFDTRSTKPKRVQGKADLPSTAEAKKKGKGAKRRKEDSKSDEENKPESMLKQATKKVITSVKKAATKIGSVVPTSKSRARANIRLPDGAVLVDLTDAEKEKITPFDAYVKRPCPNAHPELQERHTKSNEKGSSCLLWVCTLCTKPKLLKSLQKSTVTQHLKSCHDVEYQRLSALAVSLEEERKAWVLVDLTDAEKEKITPFDAYVKRPCPNAHPELQERHTQSNEKGSSCLLWVCTLCTKPKLLKSLHKSAVSNHLECCHDVEYKRLSALAVSLDEASPRTSSQKKLGEAFVPVSLQDQIENCPWWDDVDKYKPDNGILLCSLCNKEVCSSVLKRHLKFCHLDRYLQLIDLDRPQLQGDDLLENTKYVFGALPEKEQFQMKNVYGGGPKGLESVAEDWDMLFREVFESEYLGDIERLSPSTEGAESDSVARLASLMRSHAKDITYFHKQQLKSLDPRHLFHCAISDFSEQFSLISSDDIPSSFFSSSGIDKLRWGKFTVQISDVFAFKRGALTHVWFHDNMKRFREDCESNGFVVVYWNDRQCYISHPNMHDENVKDLKLEIDEKMLDKSTEALELEAMASEMEALKERCKELEERCKRAEEKCKELEERCKRAEVRVASPLPRLDAEVRVAPPLPRLDADTSSPLFFDEQKPGGGGSPLQVVEEV